MTAGQSPEVDGSALDFDSFFDVCETRPVKRSDVARAMQFFVRVNCDLISQEMYASVKEMASSMLVCLQWFVEHASEVSTAAHTDLSLLSHYNKLLAQRLSGQYQPLAVHCMPSSRWTAAEIVWRNNRFDATPFDWSSFKSFLTNLGLVHEVHVPQHPATLESIPLGAMIAYRDFSREAVQGVYFLLDSLLLHADADDPFAARDTIVVLREYLVLLGKPISCMVQIVRGWWISRNRDSVLVPSVIVEKFLKLVFESSMGENVFHEMFLEPFYGQNLLLLAILRRDVVFDKLLKFAPFSGRAGLASSPSMVSGSNWRVLLAVFAALQPCVDSESCIIDSVDFYSNPAIFSTSLWDRDEGIDRRFGLLGCGCTNPMEGVFELVRTESEKIIIFSSSDRVVVLKLVALVHVFLGDIRRSISAVNRLVGAGDSDAVIANEVFDRFLRPLFERMKNQILGREEFETVDQTVVDAIRDVLGLVRIEGEKVGEGELFAPLSDAALGKISETKRWFQIIRVGLPLKEVFPGDPTSDLVEYLVSICLKFPEGVGIARDVAADCGIAEAVNKSMIQSLLELCFDDDVDDFAASEVPCDVFTSVAVPRVVSRVSFCAKSLTEDNARAHALVYSVVDLGRLQALLAAPASSQRETESVCAWIAQEGVGAVLDSCSRLLHHPLMHAEERRRWMDVVRQFQQVVGAMK